ncbi:septal ring lytic transglycosylase RlpA family protein [Hyphomicrobium sp.]|jgi:rare lipoprotein A|uniref:septal ring lytic transglycosylase RlpA family protein n=1 Tax=Hyphomicrobium sp. TaxID=82 RepID=UPI0035645B8D
MRSTIAIAAFALAGITIAAVPAEAARKCHGSSHVCGQSSHKATYRKASYKSYHRSSQPRYAHKQSGKHYAQGSSRKRHYASGGGSGGGMASYYWQGQRTASGARFNPDGLTAAHRSLPFGTRVRVTNQSNGQSVVVVINDRGPFVGGRVIDLSRGAARAINMTGAGVARVALQVLN